MIRENQRTLNQLHILSDGLILFLSLPIAYWVRFYVLAGEKNLPLSRYLLLAAAYTAVQLFTYAAFGLYQSFRRRELRDELIRLWEATALDTVVLQSLLFLSWGIHYSRMALGLAFALSVVALSIKRYLLRKMLRRLRQAGYNQKHILLVGNGHLAAKYLNEIRMDRELGYHAMGFVCEEKDKTKNGLKWLGDFGDLGEILERTQPDEVIAALEPQDFARTPEVISACEAAGVKLSLIPFYAEYMPSHPQFDDLNGIPLMNIRHIPLDNWAGAFCKRVMDIVGSAVLLLLTSPVMLLCALARAGDLQAGACREEQKEVLYVQVPFHASEQGTGHGMEQTERWTEDAVRCVHAEVLTGRTAAAVERAEGGHESGGAEAGDPALRGEIPKGSAAVHGEAPGAARDHGMGPGERIPGGHLHPGKN